MHHVYGRIVPDRFFLLRSTTNVVVDDISGESSRDSETREGYAAPHHLNCFDRHLPRLEPKILVVSWNLCPRIPAVSSVLLCRSDASCLICSICTEHQEP